MPYFTMVLNLEPGEQARKAIAIVKTIPGVKFCDGSWDHAINTRDDFQNVLEDIVERDKDNDNYANRATSEELREADGFKKAADLARAILKNRAT
jgi:hypothetical protein